ncbi:MAG TPA: hypothetical protein VGL98_09070, partial [Gammaproteobacteria bacterium]
DIGEALAREPAAPFPARLIVARLQAPGYVSYSNRGYGHGSYSVLTARDIETDEDVRRISAMPGVAAVGQLSRVLLPPELNTTRDLRTAAAQLRADVILLYTLDTTFRTDTLRIGPLQTVSLGFFPNKNAHVSTTCAAVFIDVRTGYVYGVAEATATEEQRSGFWNTRDAIDAARVTAERGAFTAALGEIEKTWDAIVAEHAGSSATVAQRSVSEPNR